MMPHWDKNNFAKDLGDFLLLIAKYDVPIDASKIYDFQGRFPNSQKYLVNIKDIVFNINSKIGGTLPNEVVSVSIFLDHICEFDETKDSSVSDKIKKGYCFKIKLVGRDAEGQEFVNYWRLDQDEEGDHEHKTTHPYYHFQSGGDELANENLGTTLFMSAPRLAHPPMDLFLSFHFIINNFYSKKDYDFVNKLLKDDSYKDIIYRSQKRLWDPYFNAYNKATTHSNFNFSKVFPLYLIAD